MADYLIRRNGRYSYRCRYPNEVAVLLKRAEFVQALGTADPKEAARLARAVSVQFDNQCELALRELIKTPVTAAEPPPADQVQSDNAEVAKRVLDRLPGIIRQMTESVIAEQARNSAGWMDQIDRRRRALKEHIAGRMPVEINLHPLEAQVALNAMEAAVQGKPLSYESAYPAQSVEPQAIVPARDPERPQSLNQSKFDAALAEYAVGKSHRRKELAYRIAQRVLSLPCTQADAVSAITDWCKVELGSGKRASSIWTEASAVISLLKCVPQWHEFTVPKVGELRQLRGAGAARRDARAPMPVPTLHHVLRTLPTYLPRDGAYWHAALLICALYGLRPGELLRAGAESLQEREDVFGTKHLVFRVGLHGAKNASSVRDLPVPADLLPLFELALSRKQCNSETAKTRVDRLNAMVRAAQGKAASVHTLYSIRHLFADVARACGFSNAQIGPVMGHKSDGITDVYGGAGTLESERTILFAVQAKLFPSGLAQFRPDRSPTPS